MNKLLILLAASCSCITANGNSGPVRGNSAHETTGNADGALSGAERGEGANERPAESFRYLPADGSTKTVVVEGKLAHPQFVTVTIRRSRAALPQGADSRCSGVAFGESPDLIIKVARPVRGLTVRPLATVAKVTTLLRYPGQAYCGAARSDNLRSSVPNDALGAFDASTWRSPAEIGLDSEEGTFEVHVGAAGSATPEDVTFMIFDSSTELAPLEVFKLPEGAVGDRSIARAFPQLNVGRLSRSTRASLEMAATVFSRAPRALFMTPKWDLEADEVGSFGGAASGARVNKGEPVLVLDPQRDMVLTADGLAFQIKLTKLVAAPAETLVFPPKPRPLDPAIKIDALAAMLPPGSKAASEHDAAVAKFEACKEHAFAPYQKQLPSIEAPAGTNLVIVKSAGYLQIEEAGNRAVERACGNNDAFAAKVDKKRKEMLAAIEASRVELLATARTHEN